MRLHLLFSSLAGLALLAPLLHAGPLDGDITQKFQQLDTNHDGVLSGDELNALPILRQLDLNGDGKVTLEEAREGLTKLRTLTEVLKTASEGGPEGTAATDLLFQRFDRNGDGKITPDELPDKVWFARLDVNKDGIITLEEVRQVIAKTLTSRKLDRTLPKTASFTESDMASLKEQPVMLKVGERGVGRRVDDLKLKNLEGRDVTLRAAPGDQAVVLALFSASCPISNKLAPEFARIEHDYAGRKVSFYLVNIAPETKPEQLRKFLGEFGLKSPVVADPAQTVQRTLVATTSTEVFVLDAARTLVYRGAINDQYGLGYAKEAPTKAYLRDALDAVLRGAAPVVPATSAPGCAIDLSPAPQAAPARLTFTHDISRILQANCVGCHHESGIAPFSLETYADVIEHAGMIKKQVDRGAMPPWFAAKSPGREHEWMNDRSLAEKDKADLLAWLNSDRSQGNAADAPVPRQFAKDWIIGKPDAILQLPNPVQVKAEGVMPYQTQIVETSFPEDRWVRGYELLPTDRAVVHHIIVRVHPKGGRITEGGTAAETFFAAYVPGNSCHVLPEGFAKLLPAGARLSFQIHYTPNGHATQDQTRLGLLFADKPPQYEVLVSGLANPRLSIPPGEANHVESMETVIPSNMMLMSFMPHMHVRGKAFKYEFTPPGGPTETLLDIPRYDFNWQVQYEYAEPRFIPAGSKIKVTAIFDNSTGNPANPDPTKTVHWGPQTYEEMMIGYVEHFRPYAGSKVAQK